MATTRMTRGLALLLLALFVTVVGCGKRNNEPPPAPEAEKAGTENVSTQNAGVDASTENKDAANRGTFETGSCAEADRINVFPDAKSAVYFDAHGLPLGTQAEDLTGTVNKKMCPTPAHSGGGSPCGSGYCAKNVGGTTYCLRC